MRFSLNQSLIIAYEYRIGNIVIYPGTFCVCRGEREGNIEVVIGGIGFLIPENYLRTSEEYRELKQ